MALEQEGDRTGDVGVIWRKGQRNRTRRWGCLQAECGPPAERREQAPMNVSSMFEAYISRVGGRVLVKAQGYETKILSPVLSELIATGFQGTGPWSDIPKQLQNAPCWGLLC